MRLASDLVWVLAIFVLYLTLLAYNTWYIGTHHIPGHDVTSEETHKAGHQFRLYLMVAALLALVGLLLRLW